MRQPELSGHFAELTGQGTKELFSMAGLMVIKEFFKWTNDNTVDRHNADLLIQCALNIDRVAEISMVTYFRYQKLFLEADLRLSVMRLITDELLNRADVDTFAQRLDSTQCAGQHGGNTAKTIINWNMTARDSG
jgi:hypothetical protein